MTDAAVNFDDLPEHVARYLDGPPVFIPGYHASHIMAAAILAQRLEQDPHILIVGAGGGVEVAQFAAHLPGSRFTAVDPAESMIDLGRVTTKDVTPPERIDWHVCDALSAPPGLFDAATAFLCLMFVPDDGSRLEQLRAIHQRLKPGAPFLMMHAATDDALRKRDFERFAAHGRLRGADEEWIGYALEMNRNQTHILSDTRERELLEAAGFRVDGLFFKGLWIHGWEATA
jgi:tRNA (cmo5U34)-methyltransferase